MEYFNLYLYEETVILKEIPQEQWSTYLNPLLNDKFHGIVQKLDPHKRQDYEVMKEHLMDNDQQNIRHADVHFWTMMKPRNDSTAEYIHKLSRMADRFLEERRS